MLDDRQKAAKLCEERADREAKEKRLAAATLKEALERAKKAEVGRRRPAMANRDIGFFGFALGGWSQ